MNAQETHNIACPYCNEVIEVLIDCSVAQQEYVEDCFVCCQPIIINININDQQELSITTRQENE